MVSDAEAYDRGVKISQTSLTPNFREGVQANPYFQLGYQMGLKHGPRAAGMMSQAKSEFPNVAARLTASRPGEKDMMASEKESFQKEYILWALPKGETDRLHERPIVEGIQTPQQMDDAKRKAAAQGWHGFRVQILDMSKPFRWMSRPGAKATFKVEDCFYFGKGRKDRFASALQWTSDNDSSVSEWSDLLFTAKKKFDLMEDSARAARLEIRRVALLFDRAKAQKNPAMLADAIKHGNALKRALPI